MSISKIIGGNIKYLMESKKISQRRMAEIIGVTHPTLGKYLTGEQIIDSEKLSLIAQYFKLPFDYFFAEEHEKLYLLFRADQPSEHLDDFDLMDIHKKFQDYITIVDFGHLRSLPPEYHLDITGRKPNNEDEIAIEKVAHEMRKMLNIEHVVPENYYKVIDQSGIHILASSYRNDSFFGASSYSPEYGSFIFVNTSEHIPEERQIFSLFHELGHLLFHRNQYQKTDYNPLYKSGQSDLNEKVANLFAGFFLMPRYMVKEYIESRENQVNIFEMKHHFKVSIQALYMSLHRYGYVNQKQYQSFWKKVNSNGWNKEEPSPIPHRPIEEKNDRLVTSLKKLYLSDEMSVNRIGEVLNLNQMDTRKLIKGWGALIDQYEKL